MPTPNKAAPAQQGGSKAKAAAAAAAAAPAAKAKPAAAAGADDCECCAAPPVARRRASDEHRLNRSQQLCVTGHRTAIGAGLTVALVLFRVLGAWLLPMTDCDETYNYWEPAHWLAFGTGMQTWEYADVFALRSWLFVWIYSWPAVVLAKLLGPAALTAVVSKPLLFYGIKSLAATAAALAEMYAARGIEARFGHRAGKVTFVALLSSAGLAIAGPQFLPSSFAMICNLVALGAWLRLDAVNVLGMGARYAVKPTVIAVFASAAGAIVGWPFAALTAVPIALDVITSNIELAQGANIAIRAAKGFLRVVAMAVVAAVAFAAAVAAVDTVYYCRPVFSTWELIAYNVFPADASRGPELYGVEPWHFFFKNLLLNFSLIFVAALAAPAAFATIWIMNKSGAIAKRRPLTVVGSPLAAAKFGEPFLLWFVFWLRVPHKEERFMAPVYGFIACSAALVVTAALELSAPPQLVSTTHSRTDSGAAPTTTTTTVLRNHTRAPMRILARFVTAFGLSVALVACLGRLSAMAAYYKAPETSAWALHDTLLDYRPHSGSGSVVGGGANVVVCLGRDWHRFPSSFFVPAGATYRFAKTAFDGALPKPFDEALGSCAPRGGGAFNDRNQEIPGQSISVAAAAATCDVYVDSFVAGPIADLPVPVRGGGIDDDDEADATASTAVVFAPIHGASSRMLDAARTSLLCRLAFVPAVSESCAMWGDVFALAKDPALAAA